MDKANITISRNNDGYYIKVEGRATFDCSSPIENFADNIVSGVIQKVVIDLKECTWMDSTFMGTLATLGIHAKKANVVVNVLHANEKNLQLLRELGIYKLFIYDSNFINPTSNTWKNVILKPPPNVKQDIAKTVLDAHETLMSVDKKNFIKFKKVVELVKKDLDAPKK